MSVPTKIHNAVAQHFEAGQGADTAECRCVRQGDVLVLHHTEVPAAMQGLDLAGLLVQAALNWAREHGLHVQPRCSYLAAYMKRPHETQDLLVTGA